MERLGFVLPADVRGALLEAFGITPEELPAIRPTCAGHGGR